MITSDFDRTAMPLRVLWIRPASKKRPSSSTGSGARKRFVTPAAASGYSLRVLLKFRDVALMQNGDVLAVSEWRDRFVYDATRSASDRRDFFSGANAKPLPKLRDFQESHGGHAITTELDTSKTFPAGVTTYGKSAIGEDFAESVRLYLRDAIGTGWFGSNQFVKMVYFRDLFPARASVLDRLFPGSPTALSGTGAAPLYLGPMTKIVETCDPSGRVSRTSPPTAWSFSQGSPLASV